MKQYYFQNEYNLFKEFSATICFNVDGLFCRRRQFVSKFTARIVAPLALEKSIDIGGDNICFRETICVASAGMDCRRRHHLQGRQYVATRGFKKIFFLTQYIIIRSYNYRILNKGTKLSFYKEIESFIAYTHK